MENNKGVAPILIVLIVVGILVLGGGAYYFLINKTPKSVGCTQEAKICPDGSSVGRTGPNCEFADCPVVANETADWQTYNNEEFGFEIKHPKDWFSTFPQDPALHGEFWIVSINKDCAGELCSLFIYPQKDTKDKEGWLNYLQEREASIVEEYTIRENKIYKFMSGQHFKIFSENYFIMITDEKNTCFITITSPLQCQTKTSDECEVIYKIISTFKFLQ